MPYCNKKVVGAKIRTEFQYLSFLKHSCNFFVALACYLWGGQKNLEEAEL